jgi:hypothetical protein
LSFTRFPTGVFTFFWDRITHAYNQIFIWKLHPKAIYHMRLKIFLYGDQSLRTIKFTQWCSQYFPRFIFQGFLFKYSFLQVLIATDNTKLLNANYQPKALIITPYILERKKWMKSESHSFTSIPNVSCQMWRATIPFHPSMHRFYIICSLKFSQVYILDLPLLLTQKNYLNDS